jgi:hypothetical protein
MHEAGFDWLELAAAKARLADVHGKVPPPAVAMQHCCAGAGQLAPISHHPLVSVNVP